MQTSLADVLLPYQTHINQKIHENECALGPHSLVRDACQYALETSGKRFRPALLMMIVEALGSSEDVTHAALAVEYFHTASLIADDLPCMDDDSFRRQVPATHIKFGESTALLATYALIATGYDYIALQSQSKPQLAPLAIRCVSRTTGLCGATGGQYYDLNLPALTKEALEQIIVLKTVSLFEMSFCLGWIFGGGDSEKLNVVSELAYHFGMAFQIADDLEDWDQDDVNLAKLIGREDAYKTIQKHIGLFFHKAQALNLNLDKFLVLIESMKK